MHSPLLSIIICTYNREVFLKDCLESICALNASPDLYEALIVDNNSTDNTSKIIKHYVEAYPDIPFRGVVELKQGLSNARNRGIIEAKGKYLAYIDDDAIIDPEYVTELQKFTHQYPNILGFGGKIEPVFVDGEEPKWMNPFSRGLFLSEINFGEGIKELKKKNQYPFGCNMVIKASYFEQYEPFDTAIGPMSKDGGRCDDKILFLNMRLRNFPIYYNAKLKVTHQIDTKRLTQSYIRKLSEGLGYSLRLLAEKEGKISVLKRGSNNLYKFVGSIILALYYLIIGRPAIAIHLIQFRGWVLKGYLNTV